MPKSRRRPGVTSEAASEVMCATPLSYTVLSGTASRPGSCNRPAVMLPLKELRHVGLSAGDPVIVTSGEGGLRTVAACVAGGRDGGVLVTAGVLLSTGATVGNPITLIPDFEALEAAEVEIEVSEDLQRAWGDIGSGLQLGPYVKAVLDGSLLFEGDVRDLSLNGRPWRIRVLLCRADKECGNNVEEPGTSAAAAAAPKLVYEGTRLRVSVAPPDPLRMILGQQTLMLLQSAAVERSYPHPPMLPASHALVA